MDRKESRTLVSHMGGQGLCWSQGLSALALADPTVALRVSRMWFHGGVVEISFSPLSPGLRGLKGAHQGEEPPSQGPLVGADGSARNTPSFLRNPRRG